MPVRKQHVVSRVLLEQWANDKGTLVSHRVDNGYTRPVGPAGVGRIDRLVQLDLSDEAEAQWRQIEDGVGEAIRRVVSSQEPFDGEVAESLRDLLALHLVRSSDSHEMWGRSLRDNARLAEVQDMLNDPAVLAQLVYERSGLHAAVAEILEAERQHQLESLEQRIGVGGVGFVQTTVENLERLEDHLSRFSVQIGMDRFLQATPDRRYAGTDL